MLKLTYHTEAPEYSGIIQKFIGSKNPAFHAHAESKVEAIMNILMGSRNIRLGPKPSIESQFAMRQVVRNSIRDRQKIPILIPAGPKKTISNYGIDVSELSMLNILNCINEGVKAHYHIGLEYVIRLEDLTAKVLEPGTESDVTYYIRQFTELVGALGYNESIKPWPESSHKDSHNFIPFVNKYIPLFTQYIGHRRAQNITDQGDAEKLPSFHRLNQNGWSGWIPDEQMDMYIHKYSKLYPELTEDDCILLMCKYFASALARKNLKMTGVRNHWNNGNIEIAFLNPNNHDLGSTRLYYRSIELKNSKRAIPFWRSKGFIKIYENGNIKISSATFKEVEDMPLYKGTLVFQRDDYEAHVRADFMLMD